MKMKLVELLHPIMRSILGRIISFMFVWAHSVVWDAVWDVDPLKNPEFSGIRRALAEIRNACEQTYVDRNRQL